MSGDTESVGRGQALAQALAAHLYQCSMASTMCTSAASASCRRYISWWYVLPASTMSGDGGAACATRRMRTA